MAASLQLIAAVGGEPDDLAVDARGRLVWGDLAKGTIDRLDGTHITVVARGLSVPEGVVPLPNGGIVVAEQGRDTITRLDAHGGRTVLYRLTPVAGQEGVDGIGRDPRTGDLLVPDSPHGVVLRLSADGRRARVIARGLGRPVDAATDRRGDVLVPDEHLNALAVIAPNGRLSYRRGLSIPDDVVEDGHGNVWVTTLGDGGLWLIAPGAAPRRVLSGLANPQGLALDRCGDPLIVQSNVAHIDRLLLNPASARCPL